MNAQTGYIAFNGDGGQPGESFKGRLISAMVKPEGKEALIPHSDYIPG
jgi:hypothetical protein